MLICFATSEGLNETIDKISYSECCLIEIFTVSSTSNSAADFLIAKYNNNDAPIQSLQPIKIAAPQNELCSWDLIFYELSSLLCAHQTVVVDNCEEWATLLCNETTSTIISTDWKVEVYSTNKSLHVWNDVKASIQSISHKSYRDALLSVAPQKLVTVPDEPRSVSEWKPKILVGCFAQAQTTTTAYDEEFEGNSYIDCYHLLFVNLIRSFNLLFVCLFVCLFKTLNGNKIVMQNFLFSPPS
jgi:hypothetical protein